MESKVLKQILLEQSKARELEKLGTTRARLAEIEAVLPLAHVVIVTGIRRSGKSTLLRQAANKHYGTDFYYIDFEDERLMDFSVRDFNTLYEVFIELYGLKTVFFFDEVQNIPDWELYVRRMHREKNKFFITGSNANLLSSELATKLTGRHVVIELLPFSFKEYLHYQGVQYSKQSFLISQEKALLRRAFNDYVEHGGMPEFLEYKNPIILQTIYENIIYKDIIVRYQIKAVKALRKLALFLISNAGTLISYSKLKNILSLGSINTVKDFVHYLENAYLILTLDRFSFSVGEQTTAPKKVYCVDTGLARHIGFQFSLNIGKYLENVVYLELRRRYKELYYYRTKENLEVDFLVRQGSKIVLLVQVTQSMLDEKVRQRELKALILAMQELKQGTPAYILTVDEEEEIKTEMGTIFVLPIDKWLLEIV